jgi:SAM-dependent methyltransferase
MNREGVPDHYAHANPHFVEAVARHDRGPLVLDVGCWNGTLGRVLIERCGAIVDGVERDAGQATIARAAGYRTVHVLDLNQGSLDELPGGYDFILCGDVLEHLIDPARVLARLTPHLAAAGVVLVSLPNIAFLAYRLSHLLGRWNYADHGIMDRTHLRFFTLDTMRGLMQDAGLDVEWTRGYVGLNNYPAIVRIPLRWLGKVWPSMFAIQIVMGATRSSDRALQR